MAGKQMMTGGAQKVDPRVLSSHARQGSCAGRRVDGIKLASGAIAASKRQDAALNPLPLVDAAESPVPPGTERLVLRELDLERQLAELRLSRGLLWTGAFGFSGEDASKPHETHPNRTSSTYLDAPDRTRALCDSNSTRVPSELRPNNKEHTSSSYSGGS